MNITVEEVVKGSEITVRFSANCGSGHGIWKSPEPPKVGQSYEVELDIPGELSWEREITPSEEERFSISDVSGDVEIIAKMDLVGEANCAAVNVDDSIILIDAQNIPESTTGKFVRIVASSLLIYDEDA